MLGWASLLGKMVQDQFRNIDIIKDTKCPVLLIHGKKDAIVDIQHALEMFEACNQPCYLHMPSQMDHNDFRTKDDLIFPIRAFLKKISERNEKIKMGDAQLEKLNLE